MKFNTTKIKYWIEDNLFICLVKDKFRIARRFFINCYQKVTSGITDEEVWNLNTTIAKFTLPRLIKYKNSLSSIPCCVMNMDGTYSDEEMTSEKWKSILDEMIFAFDYMLNEEKYIAYPDHLDFSKKEVDPDDPFAKFMSRTDAEEEEWNKFFAEEKLLLERQSKGFQLFGLYFPSLWD